jgi:predicted PhzF superfamily epimerase YddE/YHI9
VPPVPELHLLRVFCHGGRGGNPLAVFLDGAEVAPRRRQRVAAELGLSETVFVDDADLAELRIFTPAVELDFAGHPAVGAAWLLRHTGHLPEALQVPAGELSLRYQGGLAFVAGRPEWGPAHRWRQLPSATQVEALEGPPGSDMIGFWAWSDEDAGLVRARVFLPGLGIAEDEATGSAAMVLCAQLRRPLDIRQGRGSRILARPLPDGRVEIGGESVLDGVRDF